MKHKAAINREQKMSSHNVMNTSTCGTYGRDYVEDYLDNSIVKCSLFLYDMNIRKPKYIHCKLIF